jgi:hypothetical protein
MFCSDEGACVRLDWIIRATLSRACQPLENRQVMSRDQFERELSDLICRALAPDDADDVPPRTHALDELAVALVAAYGALTRVRVMQ